METDLCLTILVYGVKRVHGIVLPPLLQLRPLLHRQARGVGMMASRSSTTVGRSYIGNTNTTPTQTRGIQNVISKGLASCPTNFRPLAISVGRYYGTIAYFRYPHCAARQEREMARKLQVPVRIHMDTRGRSARAQPSALT